MVSSVAFQPLDEADKPSGTSHRREVSTNLALIIRKTRLSFLSRAISIFFLVLCLALVHLSGNL